MRNWLFVFLLPIFAFIGCSQDITQPSTPNGNHSHAEHSKGIVHPSAIDVAIFNDKNFEAVGVFGVYELRINPSSLSIELVPERTLSIGEDYIVNGTSFFTITPCSHCLRIRKVGLTLEGYIGVTFSISHPFKPGNPSLPPTGINRLDLDVFDLALIIRPVDTIASNYPLTGADIYSGFCVNQDGFTGELSEMLGQGGDGVLPFFLVIDDSDTGSKTYNKFAMGVTDSFFDVLFDLSDNELVFNLFLTMGYGASAVKAQRLNPKYYNPEFNRKAAWKVEVFPPNGDNPPASGNTWQEDDAVTFFDVTVKVYDWQQGAAVYTGSDFSTADPYEIFANSDVASVSVEIPGMTNDLSITSSPDSGEGTPDDPLVFIIPVANENLLDGGEYIGLVKVSDVRAPLAPPPVDVRDFLINSPNGIDLQYYSINEYATYQTFIATVVPVCGPITGTITSPACPVSDVANNSTIDFTVTASSDNGGNPIVLYEADYNYDGITFDIDDNNVNGIFDDAGPFSVPDPCENNIPRTFTVAFRGTDSCNPPNVAIFATCDVTVELCIAPVGNVTLTVNREGVNHVFSSTGSFTLNWSPTGAVEYAIYYDTDPLDGLTNNLFPVGTTLTNTYTVPGSHMPSNHYIVGNTYIIRARSVIGDPSSETSNSEPAFVTCNGWETLTQNTNNGEGWVGNHESSNTFFYARPWADPFNPAHGTRSMRFSPWCGSNYLTWTGRWQGLTKQTPSVADSSVREVTWSLYHNQVGMPNGMILGTCSTQPEHVFTNTTDIEWSSVYSFGNFFGYNSNSTDVVSYFDDVPTSQNNAWIYNGVTNRQLVGGDANANGNPNDNYVAIEFIKTTAGDDPIQHIDEVAITIY